MSQTRNDSPSRFMAVEERAITPLEQKIREIDVHDGKPRFAKLLDALEITPECEKCWYFNPSVIDQHHSYRCRVMPQCPAATVSREVQSYWWRSMGGISEKQHMVNMNGENKMVGSLGACEAVGGVRAKRWDD